MKRTSIAIGSLIGLVLCVIVPVVIPAAAKDQADLAASLLSAFATVITMVLAILLYNRFGIEQDVLRQQFDAVLSLLKTLAGLRLVMTARTPAGEAVMQISPFDPIPGGFLDEYLDMKMAFSTKVFTILNPLHDHMRDVFLPVSIADRLKPLAPGVLQYAPQDQDQNVPVVFFGASADDATPDQLKPCLYNGRAMDLREFLEHWAKLVEAINEWLQSNAANAPMLNIPHFHRKSAQPSARPYGSPAAGSPSGEA
jgi:hypothetical protein